MRFPTFQPPRTAPYFAINQISKRFTVLQSATAILVYKNNIHGIETAAMHSKDCPRSERAFTYRENQGLIRIWEKNHAGPMQNDDDFRGVLRKKCEDGGFLAVHKKLT